MRLGINMKYEKILDEIGKEKAASMLRSMLEIRVFEEKIRFLFLEGKMPGTVHQYIGQEACAVGVMSTLEEDDYIASTHRPHGHALAKGIPLKEAAAELYGKVTGCCKGKGGSMHLGDPERGVLPAIAIVGGNIPIIAGMALAFKIRKEKRVAVSFFGDGASNEGAFHEGLNAASVYDLPALFVCENNLYGASTNVKKVMKIDNVAERGAAYGMRSDIGDGMDVFAVYKHAKKAVALARSGKGPTLLELKTYRFCGHSRRDPNNYMPDEEKEYWKSRDPIPACEKVLLEHNVLTEQEIEQMKDEVDKAVDDAILFGQNSEEPKPEDTYEDLYVTCEVPK
jgi:acetoin:2,6-dichlorophenolindophenol oxidoreductase subunit alpha